MIPRPENCFTAAISLAMMSRNWRGSCGLNFGQNFWPFACRAFIRANASAPFFVKICPNFFCDGF